MSTRFIARQPILDHRRGVFAYELLFRSGLDNYFHSDPTAASGSIVDSALLFGLETLTGPSRAFINLSEDALLKDFAMLLPPEKIVCEIVETVSPTPQTLAACIRLKQAGYLVALDDFAYRPAWEPFFDHTDFVKVDFLGMSPAECKELAMRFAGRRIGLVAEKIETREQFDLAAEMGYSFFQGYFLFKPEMLTRTSIPPSRLQYLRILAAAAEPELRFDQLEEIIKQDPSLCYKLLRYLNSAAFGFYEEIHSLRHAMALLGEKALRRWITVAAVVIMAEDQPGELVHMALIRAFFCESLARLLGQASRAADFFFLGMLSIMDAILCRTLQIILAEVPVAQDVREALLGTRNPPREIYEVLLAYETANWTRLSSLAREMHLDEERLPECYAAAVRFADEILKV